MNRIIKEATVKRFHYKVHDQLCRHLADFAEAYNFARRIKTLNGLTLLRRHLQGMDKTTPNAFTSIHSTRCRD